MDVNDVPRVIVGRGDCMDMRFRRISMNSGKRLTYLRTEKQSYEDALTLNPRRCVCRCPKHSDTPSQTKRNVASRENKQVTQCGNEVKRCNGDPKIQETEKEETAPHPTYSMPSKRNAAACFTFCNPLVKISAGLLSVGT